MKTKNNFIDSLKELKCPDCLNKIKKVKRSTYNEYKCSCGLLNIESFYNIIYINYILKFEIKDEKDKADKYLKLFSYEARDHDLVILFKQLFNVEFSCYLFKDLISEIQLIINTLYKIKQNLIFK